MQKDTAVQSYFERQKKWEKFREKLEYLKLAVDSRYLIESLGFEIHKESPKEIRSTCIIHGGDNKTAFRFNKDKRTWVCFTHKCHEIYGTDVISLIKAVMNVDFVGAVEYLQHLTGDIGDGVGLAEAKIHREQDEFIRSYKNLEVSSKIVNEDALSKFKFRSDSFLHDGFSNRTLDHFGVGGGYTDSFGYTRDVIPIRDDKSHLVAYSLRDTRRDVSDDDFKYILTPFDKDLVIYNLDRAKKFSEEKSLIVVEGFKSVWKLYDYGMKNVVAVMGSKITPGQANLFCQYALKGIVIMFDNDVAGVSGATQAYEELKNKLDVFLVFITEVDENGKGLDPSDLSREVINGYLKKYI
jgi:5S rRNA maturation endonuclease (ribonuclease M5)